MNDERTWLLLSLQLSGEASPEEIEELKTLLTEHPEQTIRAEVLRNLWATKNQPATASHTESAFNRHLQRLSNHLSQPVLLY